MQIELNKQEAEILLDVLERQVKKTEWVLENRDVENKESLTDRVTVEKTIITQLQEKLK